MTLTEPTTRTLEVPGATLAYDVRPGTSTDEPPLFLIGSPMGAAGFGTLSRHFPERMIVTYDPRGSERSTKPDMTSPSTPQEHADDLHRIIKDLGGGPVDIDDPDRLPVADGEPARLGAHIDRDIQRAMREAREVEAA